MKSDKDFTCSMFQENLRAFVDNELPVNVKSVFLEHASKCPSCNLDMQTMVALKRGLANLPRFAVSHEFDFKMRSSIQREYENFRNPLYQVKLFFRENLGKVLAVPAFALIMVAGIVLFNTTTIQRIPQMLPYEVTSQLDSQESIELVPHDEEPFVEEVYYVMETVKPTDIERGLFLHESDGAVNAAHVNNDFTLISF